MLVVFSITIFIGAALLFFVQPMVAKMLLPLLGGSPAVWNTCMVFFQAALLAGYAYSHWSIRILGPRRQAVLHAVLVLSPLLVLPLALRGGEPPAEGSPIPWLLLALGATVGLPFAVAATGGPLLQRWFAATRHRAAADPYFLYAASNAGSLIALLGYPILVEPMTTIGQQRWLWSGGYLIFALLSIVCGIIVLRSATAAAKVPAPPANIPDPAAASAQREPIRLKPATPAEPEPATPRELWKQRLFWIALAFIPSSLMLGVTQYISTDIAAVPLLWVIPLSIYLLTFIMAFSGRAGLTIHGMSRILPILAIGLAVAMLINATHPIAILLILHLATFFIAALLCHVRLAQSRPHTSRLTEFYLLIAVGGVLGGIFNALIAPVVFTSIAEYPIAIILALLVRIQTDQWWDKRPIWFRRLADFGAPAAIGLAVLWGFDNAAWLSARFASIQLGDIDPARIFTVGIPAILCYLLIGRRIGLALGTGALYGAALLLAATLGGVTHNERTFYGVHRVKKDALFTSLVHSTTEHGIQANDPEKRHYPLGYYHPRSPIGQVYHQFFDSELFDRIGIVGLGAGTLAAYGRPGQHITFHEIDPAIVRIARDHFTYLHDTLARWDVELGDGRQTLARHTPDGTYGLIVIDAFSSDAIPVHLMTREAVALYIQKTAPGGLVAFHISNRYLDLWPVLERIAAELDLAIMHQADAAQDQSIGIWGSQWVVIARDRANFGQLPTDVRWTPGRRPAPGPLWTDDYSNILSIFSWD